jgi:hypothetical protein
VSGSAEAVSVGQRPARRLCGAKTRSGEPCKGLTVIRVDGTTNGRCRMHGGTAPVGVANPHFVHGKKSARYRLRGELGEAYLRHLSDPDYMALEQELALVSGQIDLVAYELSGLTPLPEKVYEEAGPCAKCGYEESVHPIDQEAPGALQCLRFEARVLAEHTPEERAERLMLITRLQGRLGALIDQRRKLSDTEINRIKVAQENLSAEIVRALGQAMLQALREETGDLHLVQRVQSRTVLLLRSAGVRVPA